MSLRTALAVLLSCGLCLQAAPPAVADSPALWRVAGRENTVYLFGSVHLLKPGEFALDGPVGLAYQDAEAVVLEVDLDDLSPLDVAAATAALAVDPQGRGLMALMGPEAAAAQERAARAGIDLTLLERFEPWFAGLTVVTMALASEGYTAGAGVEQLLQERAAMDGKEILGLETVEDQLTALDSLDPGLQRDFLLVALDDASRTNEALAGFLAAWKVGDVGRLAAELDAEFDDSPALYRSLVIERNRRWLDRLVDLLDDERDYLVVVGALHLVGPDGLPAMLEAHGYEPVRR